MNSQLCQNLTFELSPLCLTAASPTWTSTSPAHRSLTSPTHGLTHSVELPSRPKPQATNPHIDSLSLSLFLSVCHRRVLHKPPYQPFAWLSSCMFWFYIISLSDQFCVYFSIILLIWPFFFFWFFIFCILIWEQIDLLHGVIEIDHFCFLFFFFFSVLFVSWESWGKRKRISNFM